jgi:hypothetical protein
MRRCLLVVPSLLLLLSSCSDDGRGDVDATSSPAAPATSATPNTASAASDPITTGNATTSARPGTPKFEAIGLLAFAQHSSRVVYVDTPVRLFLNGDYVKTLNYPQVNKRKSYRVCAPGGGCDNAVTRLATVQMLSFRDRHSPCLDASAFMPARTGGTRQAVMQPRQSKPCEDNFAVQVWANDVGQMVAVNLVVRSP